MNWDKMKRIAKREKKAILLRDEDGMQWLNTGSAAYILEGMPELDEETVLTIIGVPDNKKSDWTTGKSYDVEPFLQNDFPEEIELTADEARVSVIYEGTEIIPIYTLRGIIWLEAVLLAPTTKKEMGYQRMFLRQCGGKRLIAIKEGMMLSAVIAEYQPERKRFSETLELLAERTRFELKQMDTHSKKER